MDKVQLSVGEYLFRKGRKAPAGIRWTVVAECAPADAWDRATALRVGGKTSCAEPVQRKIGETYDTMFK